MKELLYISPLLRAWEIQGNRQMTDEDLDLYLKMIGKKSNEVQVNAKYQGGTDMSKQLDQMAVQAMAKRHTLPKRYPACPRCGDAVLNEPGLCQNCV